MAEHQLLSHQRLRRKQKRPGLSLGAALPISLAVGLVTARRQQHGPSPPQPRRKSRGLPTLLVPHRKVRVVARTDVGQGGHIRQVRPLDRGSMGSIFR